MLKGDKSKDTKSHFILEKKIEKSKKKYIVECLGYGEINIKESKEPKETKEPL